MKYILSLLYSSCLIIGLSGQTTFLSAGEVINGTGGSLSFSVGQVVFECYETEKYSISNGVQQPIEVSLSTSTNRYAGLEESFEVFPNPIINDLNIRTENLKGKSYTFSIFDILGNKIAEKKSGLSLVNISMENLVPALYILKIQDHSQAFNSYKIVKK